MRAVIFDLFGVIYSSGGVDSELIELVKELKKTYKIGLLSNTTRGQFDGILSLEQQALFDVVALSGEMGFGKPDIRAYREVARLLGEFPSDCLMIDDSQSNCAGAEAAGMKAVLFTGVADLRRELANYGILTP